MIKHRSLSPIKTAQAALLFGDLHRAFHAPQPPGPKQKRRTPPVSQFSCSPDWSLREGGPPGEKEPVFPVSVKGGGIEARREGRRGEEGRWNGAHFLSGGDEEFDPETRLNGELLHNYIVPRRFIFIIYCITDSAEFVRLFQSEIQALSGSLFQAYSAYCSCYVTIQNG